MLADDMADRVYCRQSIEHSGWKLVIGLAAMQHHTNSSCNRALPAHIVDGVLQDLLQAAPLRMKQSKRGDAAQMEHRLKGVH